MKTLIKIIALFVIVVVYTSSCKHEKPVDPSQISSDVLSKIKAQGYSIDDVKKIKGGYLVERDIFLSETDLESHEDGLRIRIANTEQYRTSNTLSVPGATRTITISLSSSLPAYYTTALDTVILRYNNLSLGLEFQRVSSGAEIHITGYTGYPNYLGYAGFPSGGNPYPSINMNTAYFPNNGQLDILYLASVMQHEVGHCIGLRHTDYMDRAFSCGSGNGGDESGDPSGEIHIWGTPTSPDSASYMLACVFFGDRTFNTNDVHALRNIYPGPVLKAIKMLPNSGTQTVCSNDTITVYSSYIDDYPSGATVTWQTKPGIKIVGSNTGYSVNVVYDPLTDHPGLVFSNLEAYVETSVGRINIFRRFRIKRDCL